MNDVRQTTEQEKALQLINAIRMTPMSLFTINRTSNNVLTIWFWRTKRHDGSQYHGRCFNISWTRKAWRKNNIAPQWGYRDNGFNKNNGDTCSDQTISLGYLILNYINWDLQK